MLEFPLWKKIMLWGIALTVALAAIPSLTSNSGIKWPEFLPDPAIVGRVSVRPRHQHLARPPLQPQQARGTQRNGESKKPASMSSPRIVFSCAAMLTKSYTPGSLLSRSVQTTGSGSIWLPRGGGRQRLRASAMGLGAAATGVSVNHDASQSPRRRPEC